MRVLYIGGGFVGSCSAAVSADSGHETLVFDTDQKKIEMLGSQDRDAIQSCLFEDGLADLLIKNKDRIRFTYDYGQVDKFLDDCDVIFMCLPTPEVGETGETNLSYYLTALEQISKSLAKRNGGKQEKYVVVVNKSTVPIDMINKTDEVLKSAGVINCGAVSNPEFLVEGKAVHCSIRPYRIVVGAWNDIDFVVMRKLYERFCTSSTVQYIEVNPKEAAAGKLLANYVLFNKLAVCFDVVGRACETFADLQFENVRKILVSEPRIGNWGLYDSLYAGGSCFIKDARSLAYQLQTNGQNAVMVNETYLANRRQLELFIGRAERDARFDWHDKVVVIFGLSFKQDTNDIRNAPSIDIVNFLLEKQVKEIHVHDPVSIPMFKKAFDVTKDARFDKIKYFDNESDALVNTQAAIVATDWPKYRTLGDLILGQCKSPYLVMDGRRMLAQQYGDLIAAGFDLVAVGSHFVSNDRK